MATTIGPLLPGRLPGSLRTERLKENINEGTRDLTYLQEQIATGQSFFRPGESPAAALRTIALQKELEQNDQFQTNVLTDRSFLVATESALSGVGDAVIRAQALLLQGIGDTSNPTEKQALADEVNALVRSVLNSANTTFRGRHIFAGSESDQLPFELIGGGLVKYHGDELAVDSYLSNALVEANSIDGNRAFQVLSPPVGEDINPALTAETKIRDLLAGDGLELGSLRITLDNGTPQAAEIDLSGAETIGDLKTLMEDAFSAGPLTLTVDIDPASNYGLRLTPSAGTVTVAEVSSGTTAADLGIAGGPVAQVLGGDLNPALTRLTPLSALNGGTGIGATSGNGLFIRNGPNINQAVDIDSATTIEDVLNLLNDPALSLTAGINEQGNGLAISTRLAGASFSIGENNGTNAAGLGILTFDADTLLSDLDFGSGVPVDSGVELEITRRDGTDITVSLAGDITVQDVLDSINAVDPGNLVATLNTVGNGFSITDNSGTSPLTIKDNVISQALNLAGSETGSDNTVPVVGGEPNFVRSTGILSLLNRLKLALQAGDDLELGRVHTDLDTEFDRFNVVRADIGTRLKVIDQTEEALLDQELDAEQFLSKEFDVDLVEAFTSLTFRQQALQATYQIASQTFGLSLLNYI